ncbi:MAG TPA: hypothetical protein VIS49_09140 [Cyclobacteriaceae bacterium]
MSRGAALFLAFILIFTFPIWIGLLAGGFGLMVGIFGGIFGIIGSIIGAIFNVIGSVFSAIFGAFDWGWSGTPIFHSHLHMNRYAFLAFIIVIALIISKKRQRS